MKGLLKEVRLRILGLVAEIKGRLLAVFMGRLMIVILKDYFPAGVLRDRNVHPLVIYFVLGDATNLMEGLLLVLVHLLQLAKRRLRGETQLSYFYH